jgi:secreted protein with Ig-like and vWFA domain
MISLAWPWVLVALPLPFLVRRLLPAAPVRLGQALQLPFYRELPALGTNATKKTGRLRHILAWLAWALLVLAAARPQWLGEPVHLPVTGRDLMLAVDVAGRETAIGDAIALAVKHLKKQPADNRVLILLTDGANTAGNIAPQAAARLATQAGTRIYTIGIGGGPVGVRTPFGMLMQQGSDLDPATLKAIAKQTHGRYFQATDTTQLEQVYNELDRLEPSVRDTRSFRPMRALFMWPAGAALLISAGLALTAIPRRVRSMSTVEVRNDTA